MSEKRREKLAKKITECIDKSLHNKCINRLQAKLDSAIVRDSFDNVEEYHQIFQSARATIKNILDVVEKKYAYIKNEDCVGVTAYFIKSTNINADKSAGKSMTKHQLWEFYRQLAHLFTKIDKYLRLNAFMLNGFLSALSNHPYDVLGIPLDVTLATQFKKCGMLSDRICELIEKDLKDEK